MAHRQRQEECLLLSVVSRSVGQHRRMRASFPPAFVTWTPPRSPSPAASLYENYSGLGERRGWPYIFLHLLLVVFTYLSVWCSCTPVSLRERQTRHPGFGAEGKFQFEEQPAAHLDLAPELQHNRRVNKWWIIQSSRQAVSRSQCGVF